MGVICLKNLCGDFWREWFFKAHTLGMFCGSDSFSKALWGFFGGSDFLKMQCGIFWWERLVQKGLWGSLVLFTFFFLSVVGSFGGNDLKKKTLWVFLVGVNCLQRY